MKVAEGLWLVTQTGVEFTRRREDGGMDYPVQYRQWNVFGVEKVVDDITWRPRRFKPVFGSLGEIGCSVEETLQRRFVDSTDVGSALVVNGQVYKLAAALENEVWFVCSL